MKTLLFTNLYPSAAEPTRGVFNQNRFGALARHCEARAVVPVPWWTRARRPASLLGVPMENMTGIPATFPTYWSVPGVPRLHGRGMALSLAGYIRRLRRDFPFDVLLAAWAYPDGAAAAQFARQADCPLVIMVLGSDINELAERPDLRPQLLAGLQRAQRIVAVSDALRDRLCGLGVPANRVLVQRNGVDGERFRLQDRQAARARLGLDTATRYLGYIGNFSPEKGCMTLLEAAARLRGIADRSVVLALVGSGAQEETLRARVGTLGIAEQVRFFGRRPHTEIPDWISALDVLCLPSFREGCPNVVLEALASGRPVVASRVGGVPELLNDRNGCMAPAGDSEALADALESALERQWEPESLRATVEYLSWDQYGLTLRAALDAAVEAFRPAAR